MATTKKYDVAVKTGEYTDRNGEKKNRYENVGAVMQGDNGPYIMLKRTFNPAGVPGQDNRDTVLLSLFEPRDAAPKQDAPPARQSAPAASQPSLDDDVPF